jgi:hypothetical protein
MRERRWESQTALTDREWPVVSGRLARMGLALPPPSKEVISYIEEWTVATPDEIDRLSAWHLEDVTLIQIHEGWRGDFYLLAGGYQALYRQLRTHGAYCSVSHPWMIDQEPGKIDQTPAPLQWHQAQGFLWVGFRDTHAFIRVRLQTNEVITPGETRADDQRDRWLEERQRVFESAISTLGLPIDVTVEKGRVALRTTHDQAALLCSWPDAFGPCQFEYNINDPLDLLVRAGRLAATSPQAAQVRAYLTGFDRSALARFQTMAPNRSAYRCSVHCRVDELPELLRLIAPDGRLYATLCEFQTASLLPDAPEADNAWVIFGMIGQQGNVRLELRLNRAPLPEARMAGWLGELVGLPVVYAPLPAFP